MNGFSDAAALDRPPPHEAPIHEIQGDGLYSPLTDRRVVTEGVVTGRTRKGFFFQDPGRGGFPERSDALFVFGRRTRPVVGSSVRVLGKVIDFLPNEVERPSTQLVLEECEVLESPLGTIEPVWLTGDLLPRSPERLALKLNQLESMLVGIRSGAVFIAPSNPFGDYVVLPNGSPPIPRNRFGGVVLDENTPEQWFPGFRITESDRAPVVNVGAILDQDLVGPLNYRSSSYQMVVEGPIQVTNSDIPRSVGTLKSDDTSLTVLTLNGFNLDVQVEDRAKVKDPRRDVDDDVGDGRFSSLASAIVGQAHSPDVVALQEIQDSDGAEMTEVVDADATYRELIRAVRSIGGPLYRAIDIPPVSDADGGQPGGNIRNGFLFDPQRVKLVDGTLQRLGESDPAFVDSRKVLVARFQKKTTGEELTILNVHLASKRHQRGIFSPVDPGLDPRLEIRTQQAARIREFLLELIAANRRYYVTGDFNDYEFSLPLRTLLGQESANLVESLPLEERYDYNHRGCSQVLMHGVVGRQEVVSGSARYEILHGNELIGVQPGALGEKPTDHGYVLAGFDVRSGR